MNFVGCCSSISATFRSAAAAMAGLRSPGTGRKITVSANIYPGSRGGNVRLDSDSELISFEIPTPRRTPRASSAFATRSLPSMRRSPPSPRILRTPPRLSPLSRALLLPPPPTLRPSILILAPSPLLFPSVFRRLRLFLNLIRDYGASLQTAPNVFPPSLFFFLSSACERSKN